MKVGSGEGGEQRTPLSVGGLRYGHLLNFGSSFFSLFLFSSCCESVLLCHWALIVALAPFLSEPHARLCLTHVPRMAVTLTCLPHHPFLSLIAIPDSTRTPKIALLLAWSPSKPAAPPHISLLRASHRRGACPSHQPLPPRRAAAAISPGPRCCCHHTAAIARGNATIFAWKGEILPRPRSCPPSLENPRLRAPSPLPPRRKGGDEGATARHEREGGN